MALDGALAPRGRAVYDGAGFSSLDESYGVCGVG